VPRGINHVDLTVSDVARSRAFYEPIMRYLGYKCVVGSGGDVVFYPDDRTGVPSIALLPAKPEFRDRKADRSMPGLHHLAFNATSREDVDGLYRVLQEIGANVTDPPAVYYQPDYYAVFFLDPDGIKLEFAHTPSMPH